MDAWCAIMYVRVQVLDVFVVLDESGSVGKHNYDDMIIFVKGLIRDLDQSVSELIFTTPLTGEGGGGVSLYTRF